MKYLLIVEAPFDRDRLQKELGTKDGSFMVCCIGEMLCGRRFDRVILRECADRILNRSGEAALDIMRASAQTWFKEVVQCRLSPDGQIVRL